MGFWNCSFRDEEALLPQIIPGDLGLLVARSCSEYNSESDLRQFKNVAVYEQIRRLKFTIEPLQVDVLFVAFDLDCTSISPNQRLEPRMGIFRSIDISFSETGLISQYCTSLPFYYVTRTLIVRST